MDLTETLKQNIFVKPNSPSPMIGKSVMEQQFSLAETLKNSIRQFKSQYQKILYNVYIILIEAQSQQKTTLCRRPHFLYNYSTSIPSNVVVLVLKSTQPFTSVPSVQIPRPQS